MSEEAPEVVDLGTYMSVLDRNQLEHLVIKMILKDESNFDDLAAVCVDFLLRARTADILHH